MIHEKEDGKIDAIYIIVACIIFVLALIVAYFWKVYTKYKEDLEKCKNQEKEYTAEIYN